MATENATVPIKVWKSLTICSRNDACYCERIGMLTCGLIGGINRRCPRTRHLRGQECSCSEAGRRTVVSNNMIACEGFLNMCATFCRSSTML